MQTELGNLLTHGEPAGLDVGDIGEHDTAERDHTDVFISGDGVAGPLDLLEDGVLVLERPGNEGQEALGVGRLFTLHLPHTDEVVHPLPVRLDVAEHHRGRGGDVELVGGTHDVEPFLATALTLRDQTTDAIAENLGTGTGEAVEAGFLERIQYVVVAHPLQLGHVGDLGGAEGV